MSTKNIYVAESDIPLFDQASKLAGGMSAAVALGLRLYVDERQRLTKENDMQQVEVQVDDGPVMRTQRFMGRRVAGFEHRDGPTLSVFSIYRTAKGNFAVYERRSPDWEAMTRYAQNDWEDPRTWSSEFYRKAERSLSVYESLDELKNHLPADVSDAVVEALSKPQIEDLDI